ncbi:ParB family protein [Enterobacter hormaechei]|uniref:ParB family protein n=1 Tax=Enterobacter hormaechei TaxID=158836 RepID=UPI00336A7DBE
MSASHLLNRWLHGAATAEPEMVQVTMEQIQPFTLNPRVTRNPGYDALKTSIRARGLDNPPVLTRRPGDEKYMLASGGNTRLAILNELWQETQETRFYQFFWPYRPWPQDVSLQQGELQCLIGHLAENDLHNGLTFIERAEGCLRLRDLYRTAGIPCPTQQALAEQLTRDGYPITQSKISRMVQTVDWLLPCIPDALYAGLTRTVIERLLALRSAAEQVWSRLVPPEQEQDFTLLFNNALSAFNGEPAGVIPQLVQDELLGAMSAHGGIPYNTLLAELSDGQSKRQALLGPPAEKILWPPPPAPEKPPRESATPADDDALTSPDKADGETETVVERPVDHQTPPLHAQIAQAAQEIGVIWGLGSYIRQDSGATSGFSVASCQDFHHPAAQKGWQVLATLSGKYVAPMPLLELLLSPACDDEQIPRILRLIGLCRQQRLREARDDAID